MKEVDEIRAVKRRRLDDRRKRLEKNNKKLDKLYDVQDRLNEGITGLENDLCTVGQDLWTEEQEDDRLFEKLASAVDKLERDTLTEADRALIVNSKTQDVNKPLALYNASGQRFGQDLSIEQVRTATGTLLANLKNRFGIAASEPNPHKALLEAIHVDMGLFARENENTRIRNAIGVDLTPILNDDLQLPVIKGALVSRISDAMMQESAGELCEFYGLAAEDPQRALAIFLDGHAKDQKMVHAKTTDEKLDLIFGYMSKVHYDIMADDYNRRIKDENVPFLVPPQVYALPEDFPTYNTVASLRKLTMDQLETLYHAHNLVLSRDGSKETRLQRYFEECYLRHFYSLLKIR